MNLKVTAIVLIAVAFASIVLFLHFSSPAPNQSSSSNTAYVPTSAQLQPSSNSSSVLFSSTQYYPYSYLISSSNLSSAAQSALAGFRLSRMQMQNGSVEVNISLSNGGQGNSVVLKPGYRLYVIEASFGDDGYGFDSSLGDDAFVMVNPNGYIV